MLHRLILKVAKFQLPPSKRLGTVVKNILWAIMPPPCQIGLKTARNSRDGNYSFEFCPFHAALSEDNTLSVREIRFNKGQ